MGWTIGGMWKQWSVGKEERGKIEEISSCREVDDIEQGKRGMEDTFERKRQINENWEL